MPKKMDVDEAELLAAFDKGELKSMASTSALARFKATAPATALNKEA